ncbi:uncharacterized protein LOC116338625 [Contarinia nasturtii]|uniref:uncharacterized protein LOC116338625 n=1 Tax=Contarinia nasturtii TaxID=265458 RepID=UPI0012D3D60D|nr:uncharacterized protein LOC116338625 [Contarinia nasturtii]XP_031619875.1 uncharacterized protein LOC116338625 [Contarinia nasturtii]XP_031619876.1 uncharacterized protein LOC116338625 [Contarinia nasturtii]
MVCKSNWLCAIAFLLAVSVQSQAQSNAADKSTTNRSPAPSEIVAEEVVVESSLNVRPKQSSHRRVREVFAFLTPNLRSKRQFGPTQSYYPNQNYQIYPHKQSSSQATAQSNSHSHSNGPSGVQDANALANAQAFQASGFGATANNAVTNTLSIGPNGSSGGNANSGGQTYTLPNGQTLNIAYSNGNSFGPNGLSSTSQGNSIAFNGK